MSSKQELKILYILTKHQRRSKVCHLSWTEGGFIQKASGQPELLYFYSERWEKNSAKLGKHLVEASRFLVQYPGYQKYLVKGTLTDATYKCRGVAEYLLGQIGKYWEIREGAEPIPNAAGLGIDAINSRESPT
ncbi:hypothetical protein C8R44DRAFT_742244 [Mycena epipterygia]|nr:hypothetical protein C8R44DRAFT_742244 [Mycena epipterygia]